jgi:hypothetical protein
MYKPTGKIRVLACLAAAGMLAAVLTAAQDKKIVINERWPIRGPNGEPTLSPPHVEQTNECSKAVYVDSFVPGATIRVFLNGVTLIGGPFPATFGFAAVPLASALNPGDKVTATQEVLGVTSAQSSPPMIAGKMPATLPRPTMEPKIYACGRVAPVHNLVPGVTLEVRDITAGGGVIGAGATPNLWGSDWDPVFTTSLVAGHRLTARQTACTGVPGADAVPVQVLPDPSPLVAPTMDTPIVGNDAITAHGLYIGSLLQVSQPSLIGSGFSTASSNFMHVSPILPPPPGVRVEQDLCSKGPKSPPLNPTTQIPPPVLMGPICPGQPGVTVGNSTIDATLVLLKNGAVVGYGGAAPGDVPLNLAPPAAFVTGDTVQVVEYIGSNFVLSNTVTVGCTSVITYHNDNQRTGWNPAENTLNTSNVRPATFGWITSVALDDQVDTQPLVVNNQPIEGVGVRTVVYVATEHNTVYAIDSWSGAVLKQVNLGPPVPKPLGCTNNGPYVGINGTPTIDLRSRTMYVIAYALIDGKPTYNLHALDLATLADRSGSPKTVTASHKLTDGSTYNFDASVQRQRSALLLANGNVYAAFASFCDYKPDKSRGWLLGWNASSLAPLAANELTDKLATTPNNFQLSSIWMSGYGVAAEPEGNLFFVTGNGDAGGNPVKGTYTGTTNIQESVVKISPDLSKVLDLFTPNNVKALDTGDVDYGSGGVMVVPDRPRPAPNKAVAAGKDGRLFILDRTSMGGFHNPDLPKYVPVGACWCGPSYFQAPDGIGRVVSSGGFQAKSWKVTTVSPGLTLEASAPPIPVGPQNDGGFFTSVSSDGGKPGTPVIWAIGRPTGGDNHVTLYAYNGAASGGSLPLLWSSPGSTAGVWTNLDGNANLVPTVANGRVYVPSNGRLAIFGLRTVSRQGMMKRQEQPPVLSEPLARAPIEGAAYWGTVRTVRGYRVTVVLRTGRILQVDLTEAAQSGTTVNPFAGLKVFVNGTLDAKGVLQARTLARAKGPGSWGADRAK